jgi:uncharacterized membrane protein
MTRVVELSAWLDSTWLSWAMSGGYPWLWPACETVHFMGLALLVGAVGVLDLRMIGMAPGLPLPSVQKLMPWAVLGFVVNLVTGVLFFIGEPQQYVTNFAFLMKMLFIGLAGVNVWLFYATGLHRQVERMGPGDPTPVGARIVGLTSLILWIGVVYWGRMLPFIGNAF